VARPHFDFSTAFIDIWVISSISVLKSYKAGTTMYHLQLSNLEAGSDVTHQKNGQAVMSSY